MVFPFGRPTWLRSSRSITFYWGGFRQGGYVEQPRSNNNASGRSAPDQDYGLQQGHFLPSGIAVSLQGTDCISMNLMIVMSRGTSPQWWIVAGNLTLGPSWRFVKHCNSPIPLVDSWTLEVPTQVPSPTEIGGDDPTAPWKGTENGGRGRELISVAPPKCKGKWLNWGGNYFIGSGAAPKVSKDIRNFTSTHLLMARCRWHAWSHPYGGFDIPNWRHRFSMAKDADGHFLHV